MPKRLLLALLFSIFWLSVCRGEEADSLSADTVSTEYVPVPPVESIYLNEISVWDGLPVLKLAGPASVNDLDLETLRSLHIVWLPDILKTGNGGIRRCMGWIAQPCFFGSRGSSANSTLYLRDGIPVNDEMTQTFDLSSLSGVAVRRADFLNDCGASIYGPNASAGVVSLLTKRFYGNAPYSRVGIAGGSESLTDAELEFGRRFGESWKGYVSGEYLKGDGYRPHADFDIKDFSGDVSYDLGGSQVGVSLWRRDGKAGVPEDTLGFDQVHRMEDRLLLTSAYLRSDELDFRVYYKDVWHEDSDTLENSLGVRTSRGLGGHGRKAVCLGRNRLVFGVAGRNMNVEAGDSVSAEIREGGVTASASLEAIPLVWVSPSVSFWHDEMYGSEVCPRMSVSMAYNAGLVLFASLARGFNSPTVSELLSPSGGNRELGPEHVLSYSGGVRYETGRLSLELDAFGLKTSDLIEPESDSSETLINSDWETDVGGVNCRMTVEAARIVGGLNLSLATSEHSGREEDVPYTPEVSGGGYLGCRGVFRNGDLGLSLVLDGEYVGKRLSDRGIPLAAHTLLGGCAEVRIIDARLYTRVENILDLEYESTPGYPAPRRTLIYGFEWDFWN